MEPTEPVKVWDAVIVGAGVSGAIVAMELVKRGRTVLILEAGRGVRNDEEGWNSIVETFYNAVAKVPNSPYPPTLQAPQADVLQVHQLQPEVPGSPGYVKNPNGYVPDSAGYMVQNGPQPFGSDYTRAKGGTTMHWLGTALRMLPNDFKMQTNYGVGEDWPIGYQDLKLEFEKAELEFGVAGDVRAQNLPGVDPDTFWGDYQYPMQRIPESYAALQLAKSLDGFPVTVGGADYQLYVTPTPQARNAMPNPEYVNPVTGKKGYQPVGTPGDPLRGQRCQGNASCVPVCPVQAKYSAHRTLNKAQAIARDNADIGCELRIEYQAVASKIVVPGRQGAVTQIEYLAYDSPMAAPVKMVAQARLYIVAAHSIETAKLLLISGAANGSDQVGRNLMDHPTMLTWGLTKDPVWPFRGPGATNAIPTFRDGPFRREQAAFVLPIDNWGWSWAAFSPGAAFGEFLREGKFGGKLRQQVAHDFSRQICFQWEFEQLPQQENRVTIDANYVDAIGLPRPVINYTIDDYVKKAMKTAMDLHHRICRQANITDKTVVFPNAPGYVEYEKVGYEYHGCGHLVGTHRMGTSPKHSVTDSNMRCWDHQNLYLVGCGSMPTFGTSNPSLSMAALAFRAAKEINEVLINEHRRPRVEDYA